METNAIQLSAINVADEFINLYKERNERLSSNKLQRLVYLSNGIYLYLFNIPFKEKFEAWSNNPVCRELYFSIKESNHYHFNIINNLTIYVNCSDDIDYEAYNNIRNYLVSYIYRYFNDWTDKELSLFIKRKISAYNKIKELDVDEIYIRDQDILIEFNDLINKCSGE